MLRFVLFTISLAGLITLTVLTGSDGRYFSRPTFFKEIIIFFIFSNLALYSVTKRTLIGSPADFIKIYLGATVLRILFFGAFIFVLIRLDRSGAFQNALFFLVNYFLFTVLEVLILFKEINSRNSQKRDQKDQ
ncbi:hypothetical protein BH09BAC3_BH09BAC3_02370 [soil metagenome]